MLSLYEILSGKFIDGSEVPKHPDIDDEIHSIADHLQRIFLVRKGALVHQPDYGIPELGKIFSELPYSETEFAYQIKILIDKYEPRLKNVQVFPLRDTTLPPSILRVSIQGYVRKNIKIGFVCYFNGTGRVKLVKLLQEKI